MNYPIPARPPFEIIADKRHWWDAGRRRKALVSMPNLFLDESGDCPCGCLARLRQKVEWVNRYAAKRGKTERLVVVIGENGSTWRGGGRYPLVVVGSNAMPVVIPIPDTEREYAFKKGDLQFDNPE